MEIDQIQPHPNPLPHPHHRKVELQSPLDLVYLRENIAAAAKEKLDLHFPPNATAKADWKKSRGEGGAELEDEDPMRARVATLVNQFLDRTFDFAALSVSINGNDVGGSNIFPPDANAATSSSVLIPPKPSHDIAGVNNAALAQPTKTVTPSTSAIAESKLNASQYNESEREGIHFTYAPYDPRLSSQLASLYADLERETLAVSQLRRSAPAAGARAHGKALMSSIEAEVEKCEEGQKVVVGGRGKENGEDAGKDETDEMLKLEPLPDGWREDVREMYDRGLRDLRRLGGGAGAGNILRSSGGERGGDAIATGGGSLTETVGKVQRARDVAMEFE
jgi:Kinetochore protein Mis14 like